jgi:hypothetical protein
MAHVGKESRFGAVCGFGLLHGLFESLLALLQLGDVGVDDDRAAIVGLALSNADPAIVPVGVLSDAILLGMLSQPFLDPLFRGARIQIGHSACNGRIEDLAKPGTGPEKVCHPGVNPSHALIAYHNAVIRIIEDEAIRMVAIAAASVQRDILNRLFDGFEGKLTSTKWAILEKCSPDTALRDINELVELGILKKVAGGRSTSYSLVEKDN